MTRFWTILLPVFTTLGSLFTGSVSAQSGLISYSLDQAIAGEVVYQNDCASFHGPRLGGSEAAPGLMGQRFLDVWREQDLGAFTRVNLTMPTSNPGGLSDAAYETVIAFLLSQNGYPVGQDPIRLGASLRSREMLQKLGNQPPLTVSGAQTEMHSVTEWLHHRGTPYGQNYSPLDQINAGNAADLRIAWRWKSDNFGPAPWQNYQVTPLMANGVLYATAGAQRSVLAIDAATGETLWMYRLDEGNAEATRPVRGRVGVWHFIAPKTKRPFL